MDKYLGPDTYLTEGGVVIVYHHRQDRDLCGPYGETVQISVRLDPLGLYWICRGMDCLQAGTWDTQRGLLGSLDSLAYLRSRKVTLRDLETLQGLLMTYLQAHPNHFGQGKAPSGQAIHEAYRTPPVGPALSWKNRPTFGD